MTLRIGKRYTNLRRTMERLLKLGVLPIVNENVRSRPQSSNTLLLPIRPVFGDNDRLGAL